MDNNTIRNMGGSLGDLVKMGGDVAGSMTNAQIANYGACAASDYLTQNGGDDFAITGTPVLTGTANTAYTGFTTEATGGVTPYVYALVGTWPSEIAVNANTGAVSGTFANNAAGSYASLSVSATDANDNYAKLDAFTITVE
jgi:hypothetical protein